MDIQIGEMNTNVRAVDSQVLLNQQILEQITRMILPRVLETLEHDQQVQRERRLNPGVSQPET